MGELGEASFPTGTVDPRDRISLSQLNTNDGFSLSYTDKKKQISDAMGYKLHVCVIIMACYLQTVFFYNINIKAIVRALSLYKVLYTLSQTLRKCSRKYTEQVTTVGFRFL